MKDCNNHSIDRQSLSISIVAYFQICSQIFEIMPDEEVSVDLIAVCWLRLLLAIVVVDYLLLILLDLFLIWTYAKTIKFNFHLAYSTNTCGNMVRDAGEGCDDANVISGDGWSELWVVESGWSWTGGSTTTKDTCDIWGDGKRSSTLSTSWDDANTVNGDGCSSSWTIEVGWSWSGVLLDNHIHYSC